MLFSTAVSFNHVLAVDHLTASSCRGLEACSDATAYAASTNNVIVRPVCTGAGHLATIRHFGTETLRHHKVGAEV